MAAKMLIDIPSMNWAYTVLLEAGNEYTFGSAKGNSFPLPPGMAAEHHAKLSHKESWILSDLGSPQGTHVNGNRIDKHALKHQDHLKIGSCEAVFQNPTDAAAGKAEQEHTHRVAEEHRNAFEAAVNKAGDKDAKVEDIEKALGNRAIKSALAPQQFDAQRPVPLAKSKDTPGVAAADMIWVVQKLSSIMSAVLSHPAGRDETYHLLLMQLKNAISADNGFVVIPDQLGSKWNVRAWVGDSSAWTQYEKEHPLPVTVTNRAYRTMMVVSNALGGQEEPVNSFSLQQLNVSSYVAIPLLENNQRRGVLYFDTRKQGKKFSPRDVRLLELAGNFILEIESLKK